MRRIIMKKIKTLSVLLSALTAFSGLSITTASATETEEPKMKIIDYPDNVVGTELEDLLYGWTVQHPDGTIITTDQNSFDYIGTLDYFDTLGYGSVSGYIELDDKYVHFGATMYLADTVVLFASTPGYGEINGHDSVEIPFPSDYEKPDVFCYDNFIYEKNGDNTLTLKGNVSIDYSYDFENGGLYYEPIVIPESIDGMTVTAISDGAFLGEHITDVTIPDTVTSIDKYTLGYCFNQYGGGEIHEYPNLIGASPRGYEFIDASDDEEFNFNAYYYEDNIEEYVQYLKDTYFTDSTELEVDYMRITGTATKAQILPIIEKEGLFFYFYYRNDMVIDEYLCGVMEKSSDEDLIPITITTTATGEISASKIRKALKERYFDEDTEFYYDWYESIYVDATKAQIEALKEDEYVNFIDLGDSGFIAQELHYAMYGADLDDTFDLFINASYMEDAEVYFRDAHEAYFSNCEGGFRTVQGELIYVIYGATKEQIINTAEVDYLYMHHFGQPGLNRYYDLTIYGEAGSYAEEYAKANGITFEQVKSEYELGDVNLDGTVTIVDATLIMKANVGIEVLTEQQTKLADFNKDGLVNVIDATEIQKKLAGF